MERRLNSYRDLPDRERTALQIMAIVYHPIARAALAECMNAVKLRDDRGRKFAVHSLQSMLNQWAKLELVHSTRAGMQCNAEIIDELVEDALASGNFALYAQVAERYAVPKSAMLTRTEIMTRFLRVGLYGGDIERVVSALEIDLDDESGDPTDLLYSLCFEKFGTDWLAARSPKVVACVVDELLLEALLILRPYSGVLEFFEVQCRDNPRYQQSGEAQSLLCEQYLFQGRLGEARDCLARLEMLKFRGQGFLWGWLTYLEGDNDAALAHYRREFEAWTNDRPSKQKGKPKGRPIVDGFAGLILMLALLREGSIEALKEAQQQAKGAIREKITFVNAYVFLDLAIGVQLGDPKAKEMLLQFSAYQRYSSSIDTLFWLFARFWVEPQEAVGYTNYLIRPLAFTALDAGYEWLALEAVGLLTVLDTENEPFVKLAATLREVGELKETVLAVDILKPRPAWEWQLVALQALDRDDAKAKQAASARRMAWAIAVNDRGDVEIEPREQKQRANGSWSRGRSVSLKRLYGQASDIDYLTDSDRRVCSCIEEDYDYGYYGSGVTYSIAPRAILNLVGHPCVFWKNSPDLNVEVASGQPQLVVRHEDNGQLSIALVPAFQSGDEFTIVRESMTRIAAIAITDRHRQIAEIFGDASTIRVPLNAQEQVLGAIESIAGSMVVQSDIGGVSNIDSVPADATPHVHLLPAAPGLRVSMLMRPFATGGPYYSPGRGGTTAIAQVDDRQLQTRRELAEEIALAEAVIAACPTLERLRSEDDAMRYEWHIGDPLDCLEVVVELQDLQPAESPTDAGEAEANEADDPEVLEAVSDAEADAELDATPAIVAPIVEWPEGEKFRISRRLGLTDMTMSVGQQRNWFAVEGELRVDEETVFDLQQILRLLDASPGRFIQLGDGQFAALTKEFRKQLEDLRGIGEERGKGVRLHPLASLAIEDTLSEIGELTADKAWKDHIQRIRTMRQIAPAVPEALQAELRDYQIDGYRWLMQLAHWGVGACLADDMGLGKTLQSLALVLARADAGPTLVVAPTSVGTNWLSEAAKFAPSLNPIWLGSADDRQAALENLQPRDLVVCSYGLLQQGEVGELLAGVVWTTAILDEAQAIKNSATQRSKAAMQLQADFRIILTGTPIENHLGELWNLFRFINPGLLGSQQKFQQRYANPIERGDDEDARRRLKMLIQPFVLRRTKARVLAELPSRTEITVPVELSAEEQALYEATRRNSLEKLAKSDDESAGAKHLRVLAEIMRLRRLCCNPKLVIPDTPVSSAKLAAFGEILTELLDNEHKALVFSQFVDHLSIVREYLDDQKIAYQYLDGSTAAKTRKKRVDAFQNGKGDVFLISLKAGGTGLNLTAADYVIHLDPWWNPAVEDQASDRAHRIGQERPVTIYRLVSQGTIEEKIVDLHRQKRDLADSLLDGTDVAGKLSADALLELIVS